MQIYAYTPINTRDFKGKLNSPFPVYRRTAAPVRCLIVECACIKCGISAPFLGIAIVKGVRVYIRHFMGRENQADGCAENSKYHSVKYHSARAVFSPSGRLMRARIAIRGAGFLHYRVELRARICVKISLCKISLSLKYHLG